MLAYDKQLKVLSQHLGTNVTDAEKKLRLKLRRRQLRSHRFYRQKIIGRDIVDFYCPKAKDQTRDDALVEMGIKVLRFSDRDVFENIGGVMERIWSCL